MTNVIVLIFIVSAIGLLLYAAKKWVDLLFPKCRIYLYDNEGRLHYWGCLKYSRSTGKYSVHGQAGDNVSRLLGEVQVKEDGQAWVTCWKRGYSPDELPYELGYVDLEGKVFANAEQCIGRLKPDTDGQTRWYELYLKRRAEAVRSAAPDARFARCIETGRFRKKTATQHTLLARAAAFILLYQYHDCLKPQEEERSLQVYAWKDTALLASVVFMGLYGLLYLLAPGYVLFPFIGERLSFLLGMLLLYLLVWAAVREVKIELYLNEKPVGWWLALWGSNVGLSRHNWLIQSFSLVGLLLSVFAFGGDFAPLLLSMLIGTTLNRQAYPRQVWEVQTRFAYLPDTTLVPPEDEGEEIRQYQWELDSPEQRNLTAKLQLRFKPLAIEQLRKQNPFAGGNDFYHHVEQMFREELDTHHLRIINCHIAALSSEHRLTMLESIQFILDFVQEPNIAYALDKDSTPYTEYVRYPDETLYDKVGDCDCKAMLAAALFRDAGLRVLYLTSDTHAAVAVECDPEWFGGWNNPYLSQGLLMHEGRHFYFCETTGDRFRVGDAPDDLSKFNYIKEIGVL